MASVSATTSTIGSPTWTTRSPASAGLGGTTSALPPRPFTSLGRDRLMPAVSTAPSTATTPGSARASSVSTLSTRACACTERTNTPAS
jgi:hypothetical protein